ncbi:MAG: cell division protein ZapA [Alphaproteobacteria bacterium]|jgi:cell division protein ZapA|nr:cell division protein ZapA [Alphaproteobacteria bacterium]
MPEVEVVLNNRTYPILCGEGEEERVREVAAVIDARLAQVKAVAPRTDEAHLLVLVSLLLGDELLDAKAAAGGPDTPQTGRLQTGDDEAVAEAIAALADRVDALAGRVGGS